MGKRSRIVYFDILNILATIAVVAMHCNGMVHTYAPGMNWACGLVIEVVCYFAVPTFFMLSGANLMRYRDRYDTKTFFKKRVLKVLVPFLFWSIALYIWRFVIKGTGEAGLLDFYVAFMNCQIEPVYWFFYSIIGIYLAMPVLSLLADNRKILWYMAILAFALSYCLEPICTKLLGVPWNGDLVLPVAMGAVFYILMGYLLSTQTVPRSLRFVAYGLGIAAVVFRYAYTYVASTAAGEVVRSAFGTETLWGALPAIALFIWFSHHDWSRLENKKDTCHRLATVAGCSFGIYLIHEILLRDILFGTLQVSGDSILLRTVGVLVVYLVALALVYLIKKVPLLNRLVP